MFKWLNGFTLVEACIATAVSCIALGGLFTVNAYQLQVVRKIKETNTSSLILQERIESMRICNWYQLTDVNYVKDHLLNIPTRNSLLLNNLIETITLKAYPDELVCTPLSIQHDSKGVCTILKDGTNLLDQRIMRVEISVDWYSINNKPRHRSSTTLISNSGVSRLNLGTVTSSSSPMTSPLPNNSNSNPKGNVGGKNGKN